MVFPARRVTKRAAAVLAKQRIRQNVEAIQAWRTDEDQAKTTVATAGASAETARMDQPFSSSSVLVSSTMASIAPVGSVSTTTVAQGPLRTNNALLSSDDEDTVVPAWNNRTSLFDFSPSMEQNDTEMVRIVVQPHGDDRRHPHHPHRNATITTHQQTDTVNKGDTMSGTGGRAVQPKQRTGRSAPHLDDNGTFHPSQEIDDHHGPPAMTTLTEKTAALMRKAYDKNGNKGKTRTKRTKKSRKQQPVDTKPPTQVDAVAGRKRRRIGRGQSRLVHHNQQNALPMAMKRTGKPSLEEYPYSPLVGKRLPFTPECNRSLRKASLLSSMCATKWPHDHDDESYHENYENAIGSW